MSSRELETFLQKEFARLVPSQINFIQLTTTITSKKKRRGNYRFEFMLKELTDQDQNPVIEHPVRIDLVAQQPAYFFDSMFSSDDEELLATGDPILAYLEKCPKKPNQNNTAIVRDSEILNPGRLIFLKRKICDIFLNKEEIKRKSTGSIFFNDSKSTGLFNITIYEPADLSA